MEGKVALRDAALDDIEALLSIQKNSPGAAPWSRADYKSLLSAEGTICLMAEEEGGDSIGFVLARRMADEMEILNLAVRPAQQRRGLGRRLVAEALSRGRARGARQCWLEVRASNQAALEFYRAAGFQERTRHRDYYREPEEDAVVYAQRLTAAADPPP